MPKVIKPSNPFTNVLLGFCFNNIFCAATNFAHRQFFFCPIPETENDGVVSLVLLLPVCFEQ